jgi:hypothetical protein
MNSEPTTTEARPNPFADPNAAFNALMATGQALRKHANIKVKDDAADEGKLVDRKKWFQAVNNALAIGVFANDRARKLKALRDELRRTKVKA